MVKSFQDIILKSQFRKSHAMLQNAFQLAVLDFGGRPECFYWVNLPYTWDRGACIENYSDGSCKTYANAKPNNYHGTLKDCNVFWTSLKNTLNIVKTCPNNSLSGGCIPNYKGYEQVKQDQGVAVDASTAGCSYTKNNLDNHMLSVILKDGTIIIPGGASTLPQLFLVDINGFNGPNKWGYDLFSFTPAGYYEKPDFEIGGRSTSCSIAEKGGRTPQQMIDYVNK